MIAAITLSNGQVVQPTSAGVSVIEREVREGRTLAEAVARINGGPAMILRNAVPEDLRAGADAAYEREDQSWFNAQSTDDLRKLWVICCDVALGASWDDEVYDALASRGYFDKENA